MQNAALQSQVLQLQEDISKDTALRTELFDRLNHAKADLAQELSKLDRCLKVKISKENFIDLLNNGYYFGIMILIFFKRMKRHLML